MRYALLLNDMRSPNVENIQVVKVSDDLDELKNWYREQEADEYYRDGQWGKHFKQGSELEWFNPVDDLDELGDYWGGIWQVPDHVGVGSALTKAVY